MAPKVPAVELILQQSHIESFDLIIHSGRSPHIISDGLPNVQALVLLLREIPILFLQCSQLYVFAGTFHEYP